MLAMNERALLVRFVPRSQVWQGSRGRTPSYVHVRMRVDLDGRLHRKAGAILCGRGPGWYEDDDARSFDGAVICPKCSRMASRYGVAIPDRPAMSRNEAE